MYQLEKDDLNVELLKATNIVTQRAKHQNNAGFWGKCKNSTISHQPFIGQLGVEIK